MKNRIKLQHTTQKPTNAPTSEASIMPEDTPSPNASDPDAVPADTKLVVEKYLPLKLSGADESYSSRRLYYDAWGQCLYIIAEYTYEAAAASTIMMYIFDMDTQETIYTTLQLELSEYTDFSVYSLDVINQSDFSLEINGRKEGEDDYTRFLYKTDMSGKCKELQSPFPDRSTYPWNPEPGTWQTFDIPNQSPYITQWDDDAGSTTIFSYDTDTHTKQPVTITASEYIHALCSDGKEALYYVANDSIICYDLKSETGTQICSLTDCGITASGSQYLLINEQKELALVTIYGENPGIYFLQEESQVQSFAENTIRLVRLQTHGMEYITKRAAVLSTMSDNIHIQVEKEDNEQNQEAFHDRIMAEIVSGKGPELLWVSEDDMRILAQKGALMDLSTLLPEDAKEQLLPGVLQLGTIDDKLVAITPEVSFHTMLASDAVWSEDSWTLNDVLQILDTRDDLEWPFLYGYNKLNYYSLFYMVFAQDWTHSPFVDLEQGISHFKEEEFIRTIELCKKYGKEDNITIDSDERLQMLANGESIGRIYYFYDGFQGFSTAMAVCGDISHITGYPVSEGSGNFLYSDGYLVVNANATHIEEIKEFIASLLNYENQYTVRWSPVRRDVLRDRVVRNSYSGEYRIALDTTGDSYALIDTKPDGSTYIEEFMEFAESAVPEPYRPTDITSILGNELPSYFTGTKSAEETAEIIHNRVQLYFDENK